MDLDKESYYKYQGMSDTEKRAFLVRYEIEKKKPWVYYLLLIFIGGLGIHKFYVRQIGLGVIYIVVTFLAAFGGYISVFFGLVRLGLMVYDLFTGVSQVRQCNQQYFGKIIDEMIPDNEEKFVQLTGVDDESDNDNSDDDIPNTGLM